MKTQNVDGNVAKEGLRGTINDGKKEPMIMKVTTSILFFREG